MGLPAANLRQSCVVALSGQAALEASSKETSEPKATWIVDLRSIRQLPSSAESCPLLEGLQSSPGARHFGERTTNRSSKPSTCTHFRLRDRSDCAGDCRPAWDACGSAVIHVSDLRGVHPASAVKVQAHACEKGKRSRIRANGFCYGYTTVTTHPPQRRSTLLRRSSRVA